MAALRFEASADGRSHVHRLAHNHIEVIAHTWRTSVRISINRDGSAAVVIVRDGEPDRRISIEAEGGDDVPQG